MNSSNNPFAEQEPNDINIDKLAQQIALTLKKLNQCKQKISFSDKIDHSDNSLGSYYPLIKPIIENQQNLNLQQTKRQKKIKITSVARKKQGNNSDFQVNNQDSQFIEDLNQNKISEYSNTDRKLFQVKIKKQLIISDCSDCKVNENHKKEQQIGQQQLKLRPIVKDMEQKIARKQKIIEELAEKVSKIRQRCQKTQQQMKQKRESQKAILIQFMNRKYKLKIYNQRVNQRKQAGQNGGKIAQLLEEVSDKIQLLKNEKNNKKNSKNRNLISAAQNTNMLEIYSEERQSYLSSWKKKLQSQKTFLEKESTKIPNSEEIELIKQNYFNLPELFQDKFQDSKIFQKIHLPLYCRYSNDLYYEIRSLNLSKLTYNNLLVLSYPKIMKKQKRMQLKSHLKSIYQKISQPDDEVSNPIFTQTTLLSQIETPTQQLIVIGRSVWQEDLPLINLNHLMKRYQCFPQNIVKYIGKMILRAHQKIRRSAGIQRIIFPQNVIFNERNDVKIDNWISNQVCRYSQYHQILSKDSKYLYLPPEYKIVWAHDNSKENGVGIWSVGVIFYEMIFGKKPFQYQQTVDHEEFYIMTELQFPSKPQIADNCKQLLRMMLTKSQNRISFQKALKHSYFETKK